jgi:hypothetical protein
MTSDKSLYPRLGFAIAALDLSDLAVGFPGESNIFLAWSTLLDSATPSVRVTPVEHNRTTKRWVAGTEEQGKTKS